MTDPRSARAELVERFAIHDRIRRVEPHRPTPLVVLRNHAAYR